MARETVLRDAWNEDDDQRDQELRPQRLADVIGQRDVFERLMVAVDATQKRGESLSHILFDGPPGLGKTTLAMCIPRELGVRIQMTSGPVLKAPRDLVPYLTNLEERAVLFIDEIHRLPRAVEEYLYTAMEDFRIDVVLGEGVNARTHNIWLKPFTLIGATTRAGMLSSPLRDRFQIREHLDFYSDEELAQIVLRSAAKLNITIESDAAREIAERSRSTPRIANNRLRWVRDFADSRAEGHISLEVARRALEMAEIDTLGLDKLDRQYLMTLIRLGGPRGINTISATMNVSSDTLADEVEPFLLRVELVIRTPQGRLATAKAYDHLQVNAPDQEGQGRLFG
ncbi:MAG: Holliday junction branch migration DNA helicase RuvB [Pirellulaceae bacterium]